VLALSLIDQAAAIESLDVVGVGRQRLIELRQRFIGLAGVCKCLAARRVIFGVTDILCGDRVGRLLGSGLRFRLVVRAP